MLNNKQLKCLELMALGEFSQKEIARRVKVTEQTICNWKKSSEFIQELDILVRINYRTLVPKVYQTQTSLLNSRNEMVRHLTAKDILDRGGYKPDDVVKLDVQRTQVEESMERQKRLDRLTDEQFKTYVELWKILDANEDIK